MRFFNLLPLLAIGTLLNACVAQSVPAAPQQAGPNANQSHATKGGVTLSVTVPYTCSFPIAPKEAWSAVVSSTTPSSVTPHTAVSMTGVQFSVTIPANVVDLLIKKDYKAVTMEATALDVKSTDATPKTVNAAYPPISFGPVPLYENMGATFPLPQYPITIDGWVASHKGTMTFTAGSAKLVLTGSGSKEKADVTCTASKTVLNTTAVS